MLKEIAKIFLRIFYYTQNYNYQAKLITISKNILDGLKIGPKIAKLSFSHLLLEL